MKKSQSKIENPTTAGKLQSKMKSGFTVVELLVVIGIIVVLAGLIAAMAIRGQGTAERVRIQSDLQGIATALEAYKQDFGDYPRLANAETFAYPNPGAGLGDPTIKSGAELLCWALVAPYPDQIAGGPSGYNVQDGAPGPGFRVRGTKGLVYGPYLNIDTYKFGTNPQFARYQYLKDYNGNPILYFVARNPRPVPVLPNPAPRYAGETKDFLYDFRDNGVSFYRKQDFSDSAQALGRFQAVLGDTNRNGFIDPGELPVNQGPYLLWSAGADGNFGPENPDDGAEVKSSDDILVPTN